ncbi:hypothetical protein, partial [Enterococcus diestrammenae]
SSDSSSSDSSSSDSSSSDSSSSDSSSLVTINNTSGSQEKKTDKVYPKTNESSEISRIFASLGGGLLLISATILARINRK